MKKSMFYIMASHEGFHRRPVDGYIDEDKKVGYHKKKYGSRISWVSTDLCTGLKIAETCSRKRCVEKTEEIWDKVLSSRNAAIYKTLVIRFREADVEDDGESDLQKNTS